jgi:hypothetical protein
MRNQNDKARWFRVTGNFIKAKPAKLQTKLCVFVCKMAFLYSILPGLRLRAARWPPRSAQRSTPESGQFSYGVPAPPPQSPQSPPSRTFVGKLKSMTAPPPRTVSPAAADDAVVCV